MSDSPLCWLALRWPREVDPDQMAWSWRLLASSTARPIIIEAVGSDGLVTHRMAVPSPCRGGIVRQLRAAIPGLEIEEVDRLPFVGLDLAREIRFSTRRRAVLTSDIPTSARSLIAALAAAGRTEKVVMQWCLGRSLHPMPVASGRAPLQSESWAARLVNLAAGFKQPFDSEPRRALAVKQSLVGRRAVGRIAVMGASKSRAERLLRQVAGALRSLEMPGVRMGFVASRPSRVEQAAAPLRWPLRLNATELAALSTWPVGTVGELPVSVVASRQIPPVRLIPRKGRVLGFSTSANGNERPVALSDAASTRHLWAIGPTGVGKSTLLLNLITSDMQAGRSVIVIEPKSDLIRAVTERIPAHRVDDVILISPSSSNFPIGLNPLAPMGRSPELVADQILGTFHKLYADYWGPRTQDIMLAALMTLAPIPGATLPMLPVLLTDVRFRRNLLSRLHDPVGLGLFWSGYEAMSEAERSAAIAPVMNKLRPFLMRPQIRRILGQAEPRFEIASVFSEPRILLVDLSKGSLGPEASSLIGALVVSMCWSAALHRSSLSTEHRPTVCVYLDEFQDYLHLPVDLADALSQGRGLGLSLNLANQHLGQLGPAILSAVSANARSKVVFQTDAHDARAIANGTGPTPEDFASLAPFNAYARVVAGDAVQPWCSLKLAGPPPASIDPEVVRAASAANWGRPRAEVDAAIEALVLSKGISGEDDLGPKRRGGRP